MLLMQATRQVQDPSRRMKDHMNASNVSQGQTHAFSDSMLHSSRSFFPSKNLWSARVREVDDVTRRPRFREVTIETMGVTRQRDCSKLTFP